MTKTTYVTRFFFFLGLSLGPPNVQIPKRTHPCCPSPLPALHTGWNTHTHTHTHIHKPFSLTLISLVLKLLHSSTGQRPPTAYPEQSGQSPSMWVGRSPYPARPWPWPWGWREGSRRRHTALFPAGPPVRSVFGSCISMDSLWFHGLPF